MNDERKSLRVRVTENYVASNPDPLRVRAGEKLTPGKRDDEFPGWIWCTDARGKGSWVPESYLEIEGNIGVLRVDYDATELTVSVGDILTVENEESGWLFSVTDSGVRGWVPARNVKEIAEPGL